MVDLEVACVPKEGLLPYQFVIVLFQSNMKQKTTKVVSYNKGIGLRFYNNLFIIITIRELPIENTIK